MKKNTLKSRMTKIAAAALMVVAIGQSALAYTGAHSFSIASGSSSWSGKSSSMWNFSSTSSKTWTVSPSKSVTGKLYKIVPYGVDTQVASGTFGTSGGSKSFVPTTDVSYYAILTRSQKDGVTGTTSAS